MFFSSQSLSIDGLITDSTEEENYVRKMMLKASKTKVFLCDSEKFSKTSKKLKKKAKCPQKSEVWKYLSYQQKRTKN